MTSAKTIVCCVLLHMLSTLEMLANGESQALVLYDEQSILPQHKPYKDFLFGKDEISIQQTWAQDGVAGIVWDAAIVMCEYMVTNSDKFRGKNILELGAGTGLAGLCAYLQGANVVLTDRQESIGVLRQNVRRNRRDPPEPYSESNHIDSTQEYSRSNTEGNPDKQSCDSSGKECNSIDVQVLDWSDRESGLLDEQWDIVIGSDIIYIESSFDDLLYMMRHLNCAQLVLSCRLRYAKDHRFIQRSKQYFDVKLVQYDESRDIRLFSFVLNKQC